eukprot:CAMPEP_0117537614 /NCGR_PEP_ID=MMETSP0784-20121206/42058_1 /TAXON_ID=39447 /ORGANISM="" /LENGTH=32 /DNA_ID= /DNA_START= /DNA_END= /DNA_ORIENTATION=
MASEPPAKRAKTQQDFIKGWPNPALLETPHLK